MKPHKKHQLKKLRKQIDRVDKKILIELQRRSEIVSKIAKIKLALNLPVLQKSRQNEVQKKRPKYGKYLGLNSKFVTQLFALIQRESIREQKNLQKKILKSKRGKM
jgi:chorismate mutase